MRYALLTFALAAAAFGQSPVPHLAFEVVSVKPTPRELQNRLINEYCPNGGRFYVSGIPVMWVFGYAFRLKGYQISGAPGWMDQFDASYEIEGKPAGPVTDDQCRLMVQSILADRFKLVTHTEMKESQVYLLTVAKNGPKLRTIRPEDAKSGVIKLNGSIEVNSDGSPYFKDGWNMPRLAVYLSDYAGRPVLDRTGINGLYAIALNFSGPNVPHRDGDDFPDIFTAVQEQFGLKLEAGKAPIEITVIDHIEKPRGN